MLGFVSGRGLADVERLVGLDGCAYAGNHGMELPGRDRGWPTASPPTSHDRGVRRHVALERLAVAGLRLEEKGATLSVHARAAPDPAAAELLLLEVARQAAEHGLVTTSGREVLEVRPPVRVDKGTAVTELLAATPGARTALYAGDDRTDADAWRALRDLRDAGTLRRAVALAVASAEVRPRCGPPQTRRSTGRKGSWTRSGCSLTDPRRSRRCAPPRLGQLGPGTRVADVLGACAGPARDEQPYRTKSKALSEWASDRW